MHAVGSLGSAGVFRYTSIHVLLMQRLKTRLKPRLEEVKNSGVKVRWNKTLIQRLAQRKNDVWERYKLGEAKRGHRTK